MLRDARTSGALVLSGPLAALVAAAVHGPERLIERPLIGGAVAAAALAISGGGLLYAQRPRPARWLATIGLLGELVAVARPALARPALMLVVALPALSLLGWMWSAGEPRSAGGGSLDPEASMARARAAALVALMTWFLVAIADVAHGPMALWLAGAAFVLAWGLAVGWLVREWSLRRRRAIVAVTVLILAPLWSVWAWPNSMTALAAGVPAALVVYVLARPERAYAMAQTAWWEPVVEHPARLLVVTFAALATLGTLTLLAPACAATGERLDWLDAAFTSVSSVCVTGLIVLDTPVDFSGVGQAVILVLIQLGGLGIMVFYTAALGVFRLRLSLRHEGAIAGLVSSQDRSTLYQALVRLLGFTLIAESVGAVALGMRFASHGDAAGRAAWRGVFTAVSAFCNAGFSLQSDSLIGYRDDPWILHTVAALIIIGGISPAVFAAAIGRLRRRRIGIQARLVLAVTAALLVVGTLLIAGFEWNNALDGASWIERLNNAWFQSVTLRTAGFNSIDLAALRPPTITLMMVWMFIGGSPGGTAGGIKTTTAAVLLLSVAATVSGRRAAAVFGRRLPDETVSKAAAIATVGLMAVICVVVGLELTQDLPPRAAIFETVSALGTVGLSLGATTALDGVGKILIMMAMFLGRVGPLTLFVFLAGRREPVSWRLPAESIDVG